MQKKRILITGGAGFIGVNAARYFVKKGWHVIVFDNFSRRGTDINIRELKKDCPQYLTVVKGDIVKDMPLLVKEVAKADAVLHLAAQVAVTSSIEDPKHDFTTNAIGTHNVLEAVRESKKKPPLVYSSTNKVYGSLPHLPVEAKKDRYVFKNKKIERHGVSEFEPLDFHSPYGCSKGSADQYVLDYARIYGLKTVVFRQSCIYGEHQFGVEDQGWVAWFTIAVMRKKPITIYGNGKQVRDVLYVGDLVQLYERAFKNIKKVSGKAFNIGGSPENTLSLIECLRHLEGAFGIKIPLKFSSVRAGDQPIFVADTRKAHAELGWKPTTPFSVGFTRMFSWMKDHEDEIRQM